MKRTNIVLFAALLIGILGLIILSIISTANGGAITIASGALGGLLSIAFTQHLNSVAELEKRRKERLQDARGLARALASEIGIFGHVLLAKAHMPITPGDDDADGQIDPDDFLRLIQLPSRVIFDSNATRLSLLEVIDEYLAYEEREEPLVERVVGFYEGVMDLRSSVSDAQLQKRKMKYEEVSRVQKQLREKADFALTLSKRLQEFSKLTESPNRVGGRIDLPPPTPPSKRPSPHF